MESRAGHRRHHRIIVARHVCCVQAVQVPLSQLPLTIVHYTRMYIIYTKNRIGLVGF